MSCWQIFFILGTFCTRFVFCNLNNITDNFTQWDYCDHPDCAMKNQHTMCSWENKQSRRLVASGMTHWMRYQILMLHNRHRENVALGLEPGQPPATNMRKLYWDTELEQMAEVWARQCQKRHDECRNTIRFNVIQNMDVRPVSGKVTETQLLSDAVGAWFSGSRVMPPDHVWSFILSNCSAPGGCNANWYSAAAWGSTWRIGCSQAICTAQKSACSLFRKKRMPIDDPFLVNNTSSTVTTENLLLRRPQLQNDLPTSARFEDFATTERFSTKESPLYRGINELKTEKEEKEDVRLLAYTFCNYGPAGNMNGFPMYEPGTPCSNCPQGTQCVDKMHRALCAFIHDPDASPNQP